jgi:50S ribosomal protein L16 3-hydroxylase
MKNNFLAGLTRAEFMRRHWQKKPLLARDSLPEYANIVSRQDLFALARREDVESRIVKRSGSRWDVKHGPFTSRDFARLPRAGWTLLVQGADQALGQAARLRRRFAFVPYARLDDVRVSYAAPGGGVGPHFDSYDVFLLQGAGQRRWEVSAQRDLDLVPDAPLRILERFRPQTDWTVEPGDLIYLPPRYAHDGVALGECITYSIGFRAPDAQELGQRFLEFLQDRLDIRGTYADPDLRPTRTPGRVPPAMVARAGETLGKLRWRERDVAQFLGAYLTEPKANVVFAPPARPVTPEAFGDLARRHGVRLALPTRMLYSGRNVFMNGEVMMPKRAALGMLARLADRHELETPALDPESARLLYDAYCAGYIELGLDAARPAQHPRQRHPPHPK